MKRELDGSREDDASEDLLVGALRAPERLLALSLPQWDRLVRQARRADLIGRIAALLHVRGSLAQVPEAPRAQLESVLVVWQAQLEQVRREVRHLQRALGDLGLDLVLLKGSAYVHGELPAALGRLFSDVDLLVPRARLPEVESALLLAGWGATHHSDYDQRYYRVWMHELPPMRHVTRHTVVDVHHAIMPLTARLRPSSEQLLKAAQPLQGQHGLAVLAPADMVLHSMTHLMHNDELSHGLRDLSDLDLLLRHFAATDAAFWPDLIQRAVQLGLRRPLYYGLRHARRILGTPVSQEVIAEVERWAPAWPLRPLMDVLWSVALGRAHRSSGGVLRSTCLFALYLRAHWLRMPPLLLVRHVTVKALKLQQSEPA